MTMKKIISRAVLVLCAIAAIPLWAWLGGNPLPEKPVTLVMIIPISLMVGIITYVLNTPRNAGKDFSFWLLALLLIAAGGLYIQGFTLPFWPQLVLWCAIMAGAGFAWAAMDVNDAHYEDNL